MHTTVFSGAIVGIQGLVIEVEVDIARGIPAFSVVGLPNAAVREARERVTAAIKNTGFTFPLERITVNLAPADVKKEGSAFDLAIAVGALLASGQAEAVSERTLFIGELALDGALRKIPGVLPILLHARSVGFRRAVVPLANVEETRVVEGLEVIACASLRAAVAAALAPARGASPDDLFDATASGAVVVKRTDDPVPPPRPPDAQAIDMADVVGQEAVKRAMLIAAAGGHHMLMVGPPGAGKTMLARRFTTILPPLSTARAMETTMIYSIVGLLPNGGLMSNGPFRAPHHSASDAGLIGGGGVPRPGEVTLAHNGVLFLDELPEFRRHVLETLREPLEEGSITISRARNAVTFPARFQLVAAMNPCLCGYHGSTLKQCRCSPLQRESYLGKISGPLLDRIAIHVVVRPVDIDAWTAGDGSVRLSSATMREMVACAREIQVRRFAGMNGVDCNARITEGLFTALCTMEPTAESLFVRAQKSLLVSARARGHIVRVARTIADLDRSEGISERHVAEAVGYRRRGD